MSNDMKDLLNPVVDLKPCIDGSGLFTASDGRVVEIRNVWASNLEEEMENIREVLETHPYVGMDTEFPGIVARPAQDYNGPDVTYQTLKCNVDLLKLIQLGLSFTDEKGNWPNGCTCWQFNFKFSLSDDVYAQDSIDMLKISGIDFERFDRDGVDIHTFGELMMVSGLVLNDDVKWLSFHSTYDFGYLVKTLTCKDLPDSESTFLELLQLYFPAIYDIKFVMTAVEGMYGGLNGLAELLQVERVGPMHQAGSDSMLTSQTFFTLVDKHLGGVCESSRFRGELFGLGSNHTKYRPKAFPGGGQSGAIPSSNSSGQLVHSNSRDSMRDIPPGGIVHYPAPQGYSAASGTAGIAYGNGTDSA